MKGTIGMMARIAQTIFGPDPMVSRRVARSIQISTTASGCRKQTRISSSFFTLRILDLVPRGRLMDLRQRPHQVRIDRHDKIVDLADRCDAARVRDERPGDGAQVAEPHMAGA